MHPDILEQITLAVREVLEDDEVVLTESTVASDVHGWDSLSHVEIVVAIERRFKVRFTSREIQSFKNVGEMCEAIAAKRPK
jgi:acyl carrier protein